MAPGLTINKFELVYNIATGEVTRSDDNFLYFQPAYAKVERWLADVEKGLGQMNDCSNYKAERFVSPLLNYEYSTSGSGSWTHRHSGRHSDAFWPSAELGILAEPWTSTVHELKSLYYTKDGHKYVARPSEVDALVSRSLSTMWPGIRTRLSAVNSLLELRDLAGIKRTVRAIAALGKRIESSIKDKSRAYRRKSLRRILKTGADAYLTHAFGIAPLLSDIENLAKALKNYRQEVQNLLDRERSVQLRHYTSDFGKDEFVDEVVTIDRKPLPSADGVHTRSRTTLYDDRKFNATMEFSYELSEYERRNALVGGLLDSIGVNLNPAIIWNAIPWTFVIDWVANIGGLIDSFKVRQLEPRVIIHNYCWSISVRRRILCQMAMGIGGGRIPDRTVFPMTITEDAYLRQTGIPSWSLHHSLATSGLNRKEIALSAALAIAR